MLSELPSGMNGNPSGISPRQIDSARVAASSSVVPITGLTTTEAALLLSQYGPNEPVSSRRQSRVFQLLLLFINPLAIILLVASGIAAALGEVLNAFIIVAMVVLSAGLNFLQTYRSQRAVDRIRTKQIWCSPDFSPLLIHR
jgi:P-type Mg2+ transporter